MMCAEANFFHNGFDRIDGIFFDNGSTRKGSGILSSQLRNFRIQKSCQGSEKFWPRGC